MTNPDPALRAYAARLLLGTGLDAADAEHVASTPDAAVPDTARHAAAALRDGWTVASHHRPGHAAMSADLYDLAQRLHAARHHRPVPRLAHSPLPPLPGTPIAVRARAYAGRITVTAVLPGQAEQNATGPDALAMLHESGVSITATHPRTLVTDDHDTLPALHALARHIAPDTTWWPTAAHIGWWAARADFPATTAAVITTAACRTRWITAAAPEAEAHPRTWRTWLGVTDEHCTGLHIILDRLTAGTLLPALAPIAADDAWAWTTAQTEHGDGWDWRRPDTVRRAALGLRARCDAADLYASALLADPLYRSRAVHTGHVVTGTVIDTATRGRLTLACDRLDARLRAQDTITGWAGPAQNSTAQRFGGAVLSTGMTGPTLTITLTAVTQNRPHDGEQVTVHQAHTNQHTVRAGRQRYQRLYGTRRSWLTTGRTPTPHRRDVPLDVLIAGADTD